MKYWDLPGKTNIIWEAGYFRIYNLTLKKSINEVDEDLHSARCNSHDQVNPLDSLRCRG